MVNDLVSRRSVSVNQGPWFTEPHTLLMHSPNMTSKVTFISASVLASITCKGLYWIVYLLVYVQVTSCRESLVACVAEERFFSRMCSRVNDQRCIRHPFPSTNIALKALLSLHCCVGYHVCSEVTTVCSNVVALLTIKGTLLGVHSPDVNGQVTLLRKPFITRATGKRFFARVCS